jgi:hypothetical protein
MTGERFAGIEQQPDAAALQDGLPYTSKCRLAKPQHGALCSAGVRPKERLIVRQCPQGRS